MVTDSYLHKAIKENLLKNGLIIILALLSYNPLSNALREIKADQMGDFLLIVSILLVTVCFANFAFTYEKSNLVAHRTRLLSHSATFIFMLLIALLLESMVIAVNVIYPSIYVIILAFSVLLYIGIALYDFWDLLRAGH